MVTKNLIPIPPAKGTGGGAAAVPSGAGAGAVDDKENCVNEQLPKESDDDDKKCAPTKERRDKMQPGSVGASEIRQGHSKRGVAALSMTTDGTNDEAKLAASASAMPPPNNDAKKKRSLAVDHEDSNGQKKNRKIAIDLSDVPDQPKILRVGSTSGSSKYQGVSFDKAKNKWVAKLTFDGKFRHIGYYGNEEDAAADYARAVFKYAPKTKTQKQKGIDLSDVPAKPPILKGSGKSGTSKYQGVCFDKARNKWEAQIEINGKRHHIGRYDTEEEAAVDYARAVYKYVPKKQKQMQMRIDLTDVPAKPPILKVGGKSGTSKYQGVCLDKKTNKWEARLQIDGKRQYIGLYDNEEDAAADYARAVFKYKEGKTEVGQQQQKQSTDDLEKLSVPKGSDKCGTSQLKGVFAAGCVGDGVGPQRMLSAVVGSMMSGAAMRMHPAFRSDGMTSTHMTEGWSGPATASVEERHPSSMPFSFDGAPAGVATTATNGDSSSSFSTSQEMPQLPESSENSSNTSDDTQRLLEQNQFLEDSLMKAQAEIQFLKDMLMKTQAPVAGVLGSADGSANPNQKMYEI